eukprot:805399_1
MFFFIAALLTLSNAQSDCIYRFGVAELNLYSLLGRKYIFQDAEDQSIWAYTPCASSMPCAHDGITQQAMVDHSPQGINECFTWATYNSSVYPFLDIGIESWIFNYSNGEPCRDGKQLNNTVTILWTCDENDATPRFVDVYRRDQCNVIFEIKWAGACYPPPPPNEACEFRYGFQSLNLSSVKGQTFQLQETSNNGNKFTYEYTPCDNGIICESSTNGYSYKVMADIRDSGNQCAKYLGVWSGDVAPFYDRTIFGQDYWDFFWMNGEECGSGNPLELLNVRYYCNYQIPTLNITRAYGNGPCQFRIDIDTRFACSNVSNSDAKPSALVDLNDKVQKIFY